MAAKMSVLRLIMSSSHYLRSAKGQFPLCDSIVVLVFVAALNRANLGFLSCWFGPPSVQPARPGLNVSAFLSPVAGL